MLFVLSFLNVSGCGSATNQISEITKTVGSAALETAILFPPALPFVVTAAAGFSVAKVASDEIKANSKARAASDETSARYEFDVSIDDDALCYKASRVLNQKRVWDERPYYANAVKEAKSRGLTCGVNVTDETSARYEFNVSIDDDALCYKASVMFNQKRVWDESPKYANAVKEAKSRGLTCGVNETVETSPDWMSTYPDATVCYQATITVNQKKLWVKRLGVQEFVIQAKSRGLTCGVDTTGGSSLDDEFYLSTNDEVVCYQASRIFNQKVVWDDRSKYANAVREAKSRGLTCGVDITAGTSARNEFDVFSDATVCYQASIMVNQKRVWDDRPGAIDSVKEAKSRGLTCGVNATVETSARDEFDLSIDDDALCYQASVVLNQKRVWDERPKYANAVREAKSRGLTCGVGTDSLTVQPEVEDSDVQAVPSEADTSAPIITPPIDLNKKAAVNPQIELDDPLRLTIYGKFFHTKLVQDTLFFIGEIEEGDKYGLRKALRENKIEKIVLISPGGSVYEGLEMANIIFDNEIDTYVPKGQVCASACSFMFFAGNKKIAHGQLGVHQFAKEDGSQKIEVGVAQSFAQYAVADIIENLTAFGTPPSVFAKMFATSEMYYFDEIEKSEFSVLDSETFKEANRVDQVLSYFSAYIDEKLDDSFLNSMPEADQTRLIQQELLRLGCMVGIMDGVYGEDTVSALTLFHSRINASYDLSDFSMVFRSLNAAPVGVCY